MSDNWLQYVPKEPTFRPSSDAAKRARQLLTAYLPNAEEVNTRLLKKITLFHPGSNWSGVLCPACGADAESWWDEAMEQASETDFKNMQCVARCCCSNFALNDLNYLWPTAFGSFVLEAMNPNSKGLSQSQLADLQAVLGCELFEIPLHL